MRLLAIGDVHGCFHALTVLVDFMALDSGDRLVMLGDYIDRGPDSRAVLDWIIARCAQGNTVALRGNHEIMMLAARESPRHYIEWIASGGGAALASYIALDGVPQSHWHFIEKTCRPYYETKTHFFVHANAYPDMPLDEQPDYMLYWEKFDDPPPHESGKIMVCGHTPQRSGHPRNIGHAVCIDTWVYKEGWLTGLDVRSREYWQANQRGETRQGRLQ